jgi:hypothetical protein
MERETTPLPSPPPIRKCFLAQFRLNFLANWGRVPAVGWAGGGLALPEFLGEPCDNPA